jgi:hypothetical protein
MIRRIILSIFCFLSVISLFFGYEIFAQSEIPVVISDREILEPYISISPDTFYPLEEILYIEGRGEPSSLVTVNILKQGEQPVRFTVKSDSLGEWVVNEKVFLSAGNWEVRARQQVESLVSSWSNPRNIRSVVTGISFLGINIRYVVIAVVALIFLFVIVFISLYFRRKIARLKHGLIEKRLKDTEDRFHHGFEEIRRGLMDQLKDLATNTEGRSLTPEEIEKRDYILRELEKLEKGLEHDIRDIGKRY